MSSAATRFVSLYNTEPAAPYLTWATAATNIQEAIDEAVDGDEIVVTNGVYATGGRSVYGTMTNRVAIDKAVTVRSVNGPLVTTIEGGPAAGGGNGVGAIRCVYVGTNAVLSGFTLTNGHTRTNGDFRETCGGGAWCENAGVLTNCVLSGNSASMGGGACSGTMNNCTLSGNSALMGGGAYSGTMNNCTLSANRAAQQGGGARNCKLINCVLSGNSADLDGGGAIGGTLSNCILIGNSAGRDGGGATAILNNCILSGNSAGRDGGGVCRGLSTNCTLSGNSAKLGGGASGGTLNNCIVYYNSATNGANYLGGTLNYSCTTPIPLSGQGNISSEPLLASVSHLSALSPCIGAGSSAYSTGVDIDGESWLSPPCIGADQFVSGQATGRLDVAFSFANHNLRVGKEVPFVASISGRTTASVWDFGGGIVISNRPQVSHIWTAPGLYEVRLTAYNESWPDGISTTAQIEISPKLCLYVAPDSSRAMPPYTSWDTAATNIQDAIDAAAEGDDIVVTNGVYATGGKVMAGDLSNRVVLDKAVRVQSVNGPWVTTIAGAGATNGAAAVRNAWLADGASLVGFTLLGGATRSSGDQTNQQSGGAIWCTSSKAIVANCVIKSNTASWFGAAVFRGTLYNCLVSGNAANPTNHGIITDANLNNCTVVSNTGCGVEGIIVPQIWLANCIVYFNEPENHRYGGFYSHCCTTPPSGYKTIFKNPELMPDGVHLANGSPCRGAGTNLVIGTDIFGKAWANPPSIGCAEWQPEPLIASQPAVQLTSNPVGFSIRTAVSGAEPLTCFWTRDGVPIENDGHYAAATTTLTATGIRSSDAGIYQLAITNAFGAVTSELARVVIHYANAAGLNPTPPYTNWATAATRIQDAINAAAAGEIVLVTNGVYASGGKAMTGNLTNRVALDKAITVTSVNGYDSTVIQGVVPHGALEMRCAWLTNGAVLNGFTLRGGGTQDSGLSGNLSGGGFWGASSNAILSNCVLTNNWAVSGGGAAFGTVQNSLLIGNRAESKGGGAYSATLRNCTVVNNFVYSGSAAAGGGVHSSIVRNSIVVDNRCGMSTASSNHYGSTFSYSCSFPAPFGTGNTATAPSFLDVFRHLPAISPLRGAGSSLYSAGGDCDSEAWASPPSIGWDEVVDTNLTGALSVIWITQSSAPNLVNRFIGFTAWTAGRLSRCDWDFGDGTIQTNASYQSTHAWTNAGDYTVTFTAYNNDNPAGVARNLLVHIDPLAQPALSSGGIFNNAFRFGFDAQSGAHYTVQCATNLVPPITWQTLQTISSSPGGPTPISDSTWTNAARFYRVLVR
jgi:PKD repeat protein